MSFAGYSTIVNEAFHLVLPALVALGVPAFAAVAEVGKHQKIPDAVM